MVNRLLRQSRAAHVLGAYDVKRAEVTPPPAPPVTAPTGASEGQRELYTMLLRLGLVSGGAGALYGVGRGLSSMFSKPQSLGSGTNVPTPLPVPDISKVVKAPRLKSPEEEEQNGLTLKTAAGETFKQPLGPVSETVAGVLPEPSNANTLTGNSIPLTLAAALLPAYGAYKGVHGLFNKYRESEQTAEMEAAKKEYEQSLADQYRNVVGRKTAAAAVVADSIDAIFEKVAAGGAPAPAPTPTPAPSASGPSAFDSWMSINPLRAFGVDPLNMYGSVASDGTSGLLGKTNQEGWNSLKGLAIAAALGSGGIAGKYMYDRAKKTTPQNIIEEAIKRRSRQRRSVPSVLIPQLMNEPE